MPGMDWELSGWRFFLSCFVFGKIMAGYCLKVSAQTCIIKIFHIYSTMLLCNFAARRSPNDLFSEAGRIVPPRILTCTCSGKTQLAGPSYN